MSMQPFMRLNFKFPSEHGVGLQLTLSERLVSIRSTIANWLEMSEEERWGIQRLGTLSYATGYNRVSGYGIHTRSPRRDYLHTTTLNFNSTWPEVSKFLILQTQDLLRDIFTDQSNNVLGARHCSFPTRPETVLTLDHNKNNNKYIRPWLLSIASPGLPRVASSAT